MKTRQELVLDFMLALASSPTWNDPEVMLGLAQDLADIYIKSLG